MAFLSRPSPYRRSLSADPHTPLTLSVYLPARHPGALTASPGRCVPIRVPRMPAMCREPLCPSGALPLWGRRLPPPGRALPLLHRSYGLMSRTKSLPPPSAFASSEGPRRLLPAPAARWSFPALSPQSLYRCLGPCSGSPPWCIYPFLPREHRPHLSLDRFGTFQNIAAMQLLRRTCFRSCSHSVMFRLPYSLGPPVAPTAQAAIAQGRPGRLHHAMDLRLPAGTVVSLRA